MIRFSRFLLLIITAASLWLAACGNNSDSEEMPEAHALLDEATGQIDEADSFDMEIDVQGNPVLLAVDDSTFGAGIPLEFKYAHGQFVAPDKLHADVQINLGDLGTTIEIVALDREQYMRSDILTQGQWIEQEIIVGFSPRALLSESTGLAYALNTVQNLMMVGRKDIDGLHLFELQGTIDANNVYSLTFGLIGTKSGELQIKIYIRANERRVDQVVLQEPLPEGVEDIEPTTWNIRLMNYNKPVNFPELPQNGIQ